MPADLDPHRVVVVGGGLIGLLSAHHLARRGHRVTVLERSRLGSGASRMNGGWVCPARSDPMASPGVVLDGLRSMADPEDAGFFLRPQDVPRVAGYLTRFLRSARSSTHRQSWDELDELNRRTPALVDEMAAQGLINDLQDDGFLMLHATRAEAASTRDALMATTTRGFAPEPGPLLERAALLGLEPGLGELAQHGFVHRGDRWLDPSRLVDAVVADLRERDVELLTGCTVLGLAQRDERVRIWTSDGELEASHAVVAAGAWSEELLATLGVRGLVTPGKGYSFVVRPEHPPHHVLRLGHTHVGVTPMGERAKLVGIVEMDGTYQGLRAERIDDMKHRAAPYLTGIDWDATELERVAPRPMTPDGKPLIGPVAGAERVVVATGHNMLGLTLAASTGELVADLVERGSAAARPAFDPMRFTRGERRR